MKLLTFFGIANYRETVYTWQGKTTRTAYAPVASCTFLAPEEVIFFVTEDAQRNEHFKKLLAELPIEICVTPVMVPLGKDENELWQIFDMVANAVLPGEEVSFDITLGLRSFPLVGLLVAAFLRSGLDVDLKAVFYGAFDVGNAIGNGITPFFDLSPMLLLLEWSEAADRFNRTGDSRYLASLLRLITKDLALGIGGSKTEKQVLRPLNGLRAALEKITNSTHLIRPSDAIQEASYLLAQLEDTRPVFQEYAKTAPFSLLLDSIRQSYQPLAVESDESGIVSFKESIKRQRELIYWYIEREHWVQAVTVCREWLVSWTMYQLGLTSMIDKSSRERVTYALNSEGYAFREAKEKKEIFQLLFLASLPNALEVIDLWNLTVDVRNDIDHAGMRESHGNPEGLIKSIANIAQQIYSLPLEL